MVTELRSPHCLESAQADPVGEPVAVERARLAAVRRYNILDTPPDGAFDRVAALAARWLDAPIASVTIVDEHRIWFKALRGLEGVSEIDREPGLCASAISSDDTLVIPDALTDPLASTNSLVTGPLGVRFYAGAPIITADGHRLGTVNVLDTQPRTITEAETTTLADLAAIVTDELELRLSALATVRDEQRRAEVERRRAAVEHAAHERAERDRSALVSFASTLQQTLLPPALPAVPGLELACYYHTASAHDVGGDFYDVFALLNGRWGFFLGDVCGKGARAAALTSLTRYTLRATAHQNPDDPTAVLHTLNQALLDDPTVGTRFCTVLYGTLQPAPNGTFTITLAGGGHPPAYHLSPTGGDGPGGVRAQPVALDGGMLIGAIPQVRIVTTTLSLAPGEALLLYSDGLTEARTTDDGELFDEKGLTRFLTGHTAPLQATSLIADTTALLERLTVMDDVALLALSVPTGSDDVAEACPDSPDSRDQTQV